MTHRFRRYQSKLILDISCFLVLSIPERVIVLRDAHHRPQILFWRDSCIELDDDQWHADEVGQRISNPGTLELGSEY